MNVDAIEKHLPKTQCKDCGYDGCRPYAEAISKGEASIDKCKPGGRIVLERLAKQLDLDPLPYLQTVLEQYKPAQVAVIDKDMCIGCKKCIDACPIDAIIGAGKRLHDVLSDVCSGCALCVPVCPVDCIDMQGDHHVSETSMYQRAQVFADLYQKRQDRRTYEKQQAKNNYDALLSSVLTDDPMYLS